MPVDALNVPEGQSLSQDPIEDAPEVVWKHLNKLKGGYIVEGVQVARMLRKGLRTGEWQPDRVIIVDNPLSPVQQRHAGIAAMNAKALEEWRRESKGAVLTTLERNCFRLSEKELNRPNRT